MSIGEMALERPGERRKEEGGRALERREIHKSGI